MLIRWFRLSLEGIRYIIPLNMKGFWIALMLGSMAGFFASFTHGFDRYKECVTEGIIFWGLGALAVILGIYAFSQAARIGKEEDRIKGLKDGDIPKANQHGG